MLKNKNQINIEKSKKNNVVVNRVGKMANVTSLPLDCEIIEGQVWSDKIEKDKMIESPQYKMKPFLKWAGGKLKVVPYLKSKFPIDGKRFVEPFLGAGSVSLNVDYPHYIVNDANADLVSVWKSLKTLGCDFIDECEKLFISENNRREAFDALKKEFNGTKDMTRKASLFIYLNRHCFNGLCRYNGSGGYNVPFGKYEKPYFPRKELEGCYEKVKRFDIHNEDFRNIFDMVKKGDVVYCDPPYLPTSATASFDGYIAGGFSLQDQIDLAECAEKASHKGAIVVISNIHNWYSQQIYTKMFEGKISTIDVARTISSKTDKRDAVKEVVAVFKKD
jgi:DNA adenine methylase